MRRKSTEHQPRLFHEESQPEQHAAKKESNATPGIDRFEQHDQSSEGKDHDELRGVRGKTKDGWT